MPVTVFLTEVFPHSPYDMAPELVGIFSAQEIAMIKLIREAEGLPQIDGRRLWWINEPKGLMLKIIDETCFGRIRSIPIDGVAFPEHKR